MKPVISSNINQDLATFLQENAYSSFAILVDENTRKHCLPRLGQVTEKACIIEIKSGEKNKTLETCQYIWECMTNEVMDRKSLLINLGGGVIGDMGGFCAATYKRGIDFINIPTTLLAQVDASLGGKLGVDFNGFKNHIGLFHDPKAVFVANEFLETLSKRELRSGLAEMIKHALIGSRAQWNLLQTMNWEELDLSQLVPSSIEIKRSVVEEDPFEKGKRKILNFGHTIGHAIESYFLDTSEHLLHGEAIAAGMICEGYIARTKGLISQEELEQITHYISSIYGTVKLNEDQFNPILELMQMDKKNENQKILLALPDGIGKATWDVEANRSILIDAMHYYINFQI